jgi:hypothetical protein
MTLAACLARSALLGALANAAFRLRLDTEGNLIHCYARMAAREVERLLGVERLSPAETFDNGEGPWS